MANAVQTGLNMLQVAVVRMPFLCASASGALMVAELAIRALKGGLGAFGFTGESKAGKYIYDNTPEFVGRVLRPYKNKEDYSNEKLVAYAVAACVIGAFGSDLVSIVFGQVPPIYNRVLTYLGPVRISQDYHPATQWVMSHFGL